jgi:hypothetical protein
MQSIPSDYILLLFLGVLFSNISIITAFCAVAGSTVFNNIYYETRPIYKGLVFMVGRLSVNWYNFNDVSEILTMMNRLLKYRGKQDLFYKNEPIVYCQESYIVIMWYIRVITMGWSSRCYIPACTKIETARFKA